MRTYFTHKSKGWTYMFTGFMGLVDPQQTDDNMELLDCAPIGVKMRSIDTDGIPFGPEFVIDIDTFAREYVISLDKYEMSSEQEEKIKLDIIQE